jgi:alpha-tubulin suppressor-like RCC1 family protein
MNSIKIDNAFSDLFLKNFSHNNKRLSNKLNEYFKETIKLTFVTNGEVIILTVDDKLYKLGIEEQTVLLGLDPNVDNQNSYIDSLIVDKLCNKSIIDFSNGYSHVMARTLYDKVYCWGFNFCGQLGNGIQDNNRKKTYFEPELNQYLSDKKIIDIKCGIGHSLALTAGGDVLGWGWNEYGQIGNRCDASQLVPIKIKGFNNEKIKAISCGSCHSLALTESGRVYSWGWNGFGQLGHRNQIDANSPKPIKINTKIDKISSGFHYSLLLSCDKDIYSFGENSFHQLGIKEKDNQLTPIRINDSNKFKDISCFNLISAALSENDAYFVWGYGFGYQMKEQKFNSFDEIFVFYERSTPKPFPGKLQFKDYFIQNDRYRSLFEQIGEIGSGSFGNVYKVKKKVLEERFYAMKIIKVPKQEVELLREFQSSIIVTKLDEKYVAQYYNAWFENNYVEEEDKRVEEKDKQVEEKVKRVYQTSLLFHIQMELCDLTLEDIIDEFEEDSNFMQNDLLTLLGFYIASQLFIEVLEGVHYLHTRDPQIIHRDLKPSNILLKKGSGERFIKIADFGLATLHELSGKAHSEDVGTVKFQAPEVINSKEYTTKADVYSLGVVLLRLFNVYDIDKYWI